MEIMKLKRLFLLLPILMSFCIFCINNDLHKENSPIVKIEKWNLYEDNGITANITINTHENGSVSCEGDWNFYYSGSELSCNELSGSVSKDSTYFSIYCYGTASSIDILGTIEKSSFSLEFHGEFKNERCSGNWKISFDEEDWDDIQSHYFDGILVSERIITQ